VFGNRGNRNVNNGLEADIPGKSGNLFTDNVFNFDGLHGVCAVTGAATDGGSNKGHGNDLPPDVLFGAGAC
jgi:hypothetical protein